MHHTGVAQPITMGKARANLSVSKAQCKSESGSYPGATGHLGISIISTRGASLSSSIVWFPNGSLGRSLADVGVGKLTTNTRTVTNAAIYMFRAALYKQTLGGALSGLQQ